MSNVVISLAIIGKDNEPLFMTEFLESHGRRRDLLDENELFGISSGNSEDNNADEAKNDDPTESNVEDSSDSDYSGIVEQLKSYRLARISLKQEFILHSALDRFEQLSGPPPGYAWRKTTAKETNPMYVGLLYPVEDYRVFGWVTTTRIKFFVVVTDDPSHSSFRGNGMDSSSALNHGVPPAPMRPQSPLSPRSILGGGDRQNMEPQLDTDVVLQKLFESIHQCYVSYVLNPFSPLVMSSSSKISSKRFDEYIQAAVTKHNQFCYRESPPF